MWNVIYAEWPKEINYTEKCALFWRQSLCKRSRCFNVDIRWQSKSYEGSLSISLFRTATKILFAFISREKGVLKVTLPSTLIFSAKMFARLTLQFLFTYICICNRLRSVFFFFSNGGLRDRDILFRDEMDLVHVFCFFSCLVKFPAHETINSWRRRASPNPGNWVCVFFSFFPLPTALAFFHDQTHTLTQTRKVRRQAERPKGDREQFASLDFWITD